MAIVPYPAAGPYACKCSNPAGARSRVGGHLHRYDLVRVLHRLAALDLVDILHARGHFAPHRVLAIEEARVTEADEKLAVRGVGIVGARHRAHPAHVRRLVELGLELL